VTSLRIVADPVDPDAILVVANEQVPGGIRVIPTAAAYAFWTHSFAPRLAVTVNGGSLDRRE